MWDFFPFLAFKIGYLRKLDSFTSLFICNWNLLKPTLIIFRFIDYSAVESGNNGSLSHTRSIFLFFNELFSISYTLLSIFFLFIKFDIYIIHFHDILKKISLKGKIYHDAKLLLTFSNSTFILWSLEAYLFKASKN